MICERSGECYFANEQRINCNPNVLFASDPRPSAEQLCIQAMETVLALKKRQHENALATLESHGTAKIKRPHAVLAQWQRRVVSTGFHLAWADLEHSLGRNHTQTEASNVIQRVNEQVGAVQEYAERFDLSLSGIAVKSMRLAAYLPAFRDRLQGKPPTKNSMRSANVGNALILATCRQPNENTPFSEDRLGSAAEIIREHLANRTLNASRFLFTASPREDNHNRLTPENFSHDAYNLSGKEKTTMLQEKYSDEDRGNYGKEVTLTTLAPLIARGNGFPTCPPPSTTFYEVDPEELAALEIHTNNISIPIDHTDQRFEVSLHSVTDLLIREQIADATPISNGEKSLLDLLSAHAIIAK